MATESPYQTKPWHFHDIVGVSAWYGGSEDGERTVVEGETMAL